MPLFTLYQLIYISRCTIDGSPTDVARELQEILHTARQNNRQDNVTGALFYSGRHFGQVIEGPRDVLASLYTKLLADERHADVFELAFERIDRRKFPGWAMSLAVVGDTPISAFVEVDAIPDKVPVEEGGIQAVELLRYLLGTQERADDTHDQIAKGDKPNKISSTED